MDRKKLQYIAVEVPLPGILFFGIDSITVGFFPFNWTLTSGQIGNYRFVEFGPFSVNWVILR